MNHYEFYSANGNTFCVIRSDESIINKSRLARIIGLTYGVDSIIFLNPEEASMQFYDKSGYHDVMCGNALRVTAHVLNEEGVLSKKDQIRTDDGLKKVIITNEGLEVEVGGRIT